MARKELLFGEFPPGSYEKWEEKINSDLKGVPYETLITKTIEGIDIKPFYHKNDINDLKYLASHPDEFPYNRSSKIQLNDWEIQQDIEVNNFGEANKKALNALNKGASAISFNIADDLKLDEKNFSILLEGIIIDCIQIEFRSPGREEIIFSLLKQEVQKRNFDPQKINGSLNIDSLGDITTNGSKSAKSTVDYLRISELIKSSSSVFPHLRIIGINGHIFQNAGSSAVQELGYSLSKITEYLHNLTEVGLTIDQISPYFQLNFASGPSYFIEIAKIRAARILFANLVKAYNPKNKDSEKIFIHSNTSEWNQTVYDPYVNMLRGTTESMSAVLGGVNSISILSFDKSFRETTKFSDRIARNTQIILKEEAHLDKVVDPSAGSYYLESLTNSIAEKAWELFLEIEQADGYFESLKAGHIQSAIHETAGKRDLNIATRKEILLGTNQYPNPNEKIQEDFIKGKAFPKENDSLEFVINPLRKYRGSKAFEELRLRTELSGKIPSVFILSYGNLTWRKSRAGFSNGYFACAGYEISAQNSFGNIEEGIKAANNSNANIVVFCSSDDEYMNISSEDIKKINTGIIPVIAGDPKEKLDHFKSIGIQHFIHMKTNILEKLTVFNQLLGIN